MIGPIGKKDSPERVWSDDVFFNLVEPIANANGFEAFRTIDDSRPGDITDQVIKALYDSDLVVADLTGNNPNAMYELAIRHSTGLPFIHISDDASSIPFDISVLSTVIIDSNGFGGTQKTVAELDKHFKAILNNEAVFDNPVSKYLTHKRVLESGSDEEKEIATLRAEVSDLARRVSASEATPTVDRTGRPTDRVIDYFWSFEDGKRMQRIRNLEAHTRDNKSSSDLVDRIGSSDADQNDDE